AHDPVTQDLRADHRRGVPIGETWDLELRSPDGGVQSVELEQLASWTDPDCPVPEHFSGICAYETTFDAPVVGGTFGLELETDLQLDLGRVAGVARIWLNGEDLGVVWHPPYAVDVRGRLRKSGNTLRVEVANTWHNRLVGDAGLAPEERTTVTNIRGPFTETTPLIEAGLMGPVRVTSEAWSLPRPTPAQLAWQEAEFGVVFHYDLHVCGEGRYVQSRNRLEPIEDVNRFAPSQLDTDQWVQAAKAAGATFAILTGSHETGFRLWQSEVNPYCLSAVRWGNGERDIVAEFHASCMRHGLKPGVYLGTRWNSQLGVYDFKVTERSSMTQEEYNRLIEAEVTEICTRYGDWFEFWFDGGAHGPDQGGPDVLSIVERHQPGAVFYHNLQRADALWGGSESGTVGYPCWATFPYPATGSGESARPEISADGFRLLKHGDPAGRHWLPAMSDAPLRGRGGHEWFWEPGQDHLIYSREQLVDMYCRSVGRNSTLILGLTPDDRGLLPDADVLRLAELGADLSSMFEGLVSAPGTELTFKGGARPVDLIVLQEDIRLGERVRRYRVEARSGGAWRTVAQGSCIGHKRIHRLDAPIQADGVRLVVERSAAAPRITAIQAGLDARERR
ncbi:MAG: alpha-L-fucosidase, partial [Planctomycetota bacterium]